MKVENLILKMWGIGSLYVRYHTSIIALCVSEYLKAGFTFNIAVKSVGDSSNSFAYKSACISISENVEKGTEISEAIKLQEKLMPDWSSILGLASQTGRLASQFERFYINNLSYLEKVNSTKKLF